MSFTNEIKSGYDTELLILRSLFALDPTTNLPISTNLILTTDGQGGLLWVNALDNLSSSGAVGYLPSTLSTLSGFEFALSNDLSTISTLTTDNYIYLSTLIQTQLPGGVSQSNLVSTVEGLGTIGYLSTTTSGYATNNDVASTVQGLATYGYISSASFFSTLNNLGSLDFVSSASLTSSLVGLGTMRYISSLSQLGDLGFVSTASLTSSLEGLGTLEYISTSGLQSTVVGLGTVGYVSTAGLNALSNYIFDASRYISTGNLISVSQQVAAPIYVDRAGNLIITGGTTIISSAASVVYLSTFLFSSITYEGTNGEIFGTILSNNTPDSNFGADMIFSSALVRFDYISSYINSNSRVYLDVYPTFAFSELNTAASNYLLLPISTFLAYGSSNLFPQTTTYLVANNKTAGFTNWTQQPLKIQIPGNLIAGNYTSN